eukprot:s3795_g6.t1
MGKESRLPSALSEAIRFVCSNPMHVVARHRHDTLAHWLARAARAKELTTDEAKLHDSLHGDLRGILSPKRLLLWVEMMVHHGYPDVEVFDEVVAGVELSGAAPFVPSFDPSFKPALMTPAELEKNAPGARAALFASIRSTGFRVG